MLLAALALAVRALAPVLLVLDALLVVALVVEWVRLVDPATLVVDRHLPQRAGLSREVTRTLRLSAGEAADERDAARVAGLRVEAHEEFPSAFEVTARMLPSGIAPPAAGDPSGGPDVGRFAADGTLTLERRYRSSRRGAYALGDLRLRLRGRLGLLERQTRLAGHQPLAVEPALLGLKRTLELAASERWHDLGVRLLRRRGGETEFESLREYLRGDDVRRMDWKAFARRGKPMVRQYEVERGQELILLVDRGRRMRVATAEGEHRGWTKLDWALDAGLELAAVALSKGDRVGVGAFERGLTTWVAPARGARQLTRLTQALFELLPSDRDADLGRALRELAALHRRSATVILLSDVADPYGVDLQRRELEAASRRHRLVFAALDDPGLRSAAEPPVEDEGAAGVTTAVATAQRAASLELIADRRRALAHLASSGVRVLDALPAEAAAPLLAAWLEERRR